MRFLLPILLLALVLPASGCRDTLVDPIDDPVTETPAPESTSPYFKGPTEMVAGNAGNFRVEYVEGASDYDWTVEDYSTGRLQGSFSTDASGLERFFSAVAAEAGSVTLFVSIKDEDGRALAGVTKTVLIAPR